MKLHLGCGNKLFDGWVNVDIGDYGQEVQCDLMELPFEDDEADEILSVHVVEHFYPWETPLLLKEWRRVLKPGAPIAIECPDLMKACEHMVAKRNQQLSYWPIYGDPDHVNPYMMHKWGWTPRSLIKLMEFCGFHDVTEKPAQHKLGPVRDLRVEALG